MGMNLLSDELISIEDPQGLALRVSLPDLLARLSSSRVKRLSAVRPHQEAAVHMFLVSLAFMGLEAAGLDALPEEPSVWASALRRLTPEYPGEEPWQLLVEDWSKPAFMQVPTEPRSSASYKKEVASPQAVDVLTPGRCHDIKPEKMRSCAGGNAELWLWALVSLGADACYTGAGNFGCFRKNGGYAARSHVRLAMGRGPGAEFRRDVLTLLERCGDLDSAANSCGVGTRDRKSLLWTQPWGDSDGQLALADLHPLCLEVPRRIRLARDPRGRLFARTATSKKARVSSDDSRGVVADPWAVVVRDPKGDKGWNPQLETGGVSYRRLAPVLFDRTAFTLPLLALPTKAETSQPGVLLIRVLGRAQGGTDGLLEREVQIPPAAMGRFAQAPDELALRSKAFVQAASEMSGKVLRAALLVYAGGSSKADGKNKGFVAGVSPWQTEFENQVDRVFFEFLMDSVQAGHDEQTALRAWASRLFQLASDVFPRATQALMTRDRSRVLAKSRASSFMRNEAYKVFPSLRPQAAAPSSFKEESCDTV